MNSELRILLTGHICGDAFEWHIAPLPMTDENLFVSLYMNSITTLGTPTEYFWDGFYACREGQLIDDMPTEQQKIGWREAKKTEDEHASLFDDAAPAVDDGSIEDDQDWIRGGC